MCFLAHKKLTKICFPANLECFEYGGQTMKPMIKNSCLFLCLFALLSYIPLGAQAVKLIDSTQTAETPFIQVMKNGDIMLVYTEGYHINADAELKYMIYSQTTKAWSAPKVAVKKRFSQSFPQLAMDDAGDIHMAYQDGNSSDNREICYAMFSNNNNAWSNGAVAYESSGVNDTWPRIRVEGDDIYIVWSHNYPAGVGEMDICMVTNKKGSSWPVAKNARKTISETGQAVSIHSAFDVKDKNIYAVWMDTNHAIGTGMWGLYYNEGIYNTTAKDWSWKVAQYLFPELSTHYYPALTTDPSGSVHVLFSNRSGPFWYARKTGNTWSDPKSLSANWCDFTFINFIKYANGLLHALWKETTSTGQGVFYGRGLPDGTWAKSIKVGEGINPQYPGLDVDAQGNVHVTFTDGEDDYTRDVYYAKVELPGNPPQAVIETSAKTGIIPLTITFDASKSTDSDGQIIDYRWDFGDGGKATGKKVTYTYTKKGKYKAILSVLDNDFRVGTAQVEIVATMGEPFASFVASSTRGMVPLTVTFDASESMDVDGTISSYGWSFGDGTTGTGKVTTKTYTQGGTYPVILTVTDNEGKSGTASMNVVAFQKPTAKFTATPTYGVLPLKVDFDASASTDVDGTIASYKWDFGDGTTDQGKTVSHTFSATGTFMVVLTVTDNDSYTGTASQFIEVLAKPEAPLGVSVERLVNKSLFYTDAINKVTWQANPKNSGLFTIVKYKIYRKGKDEGNDKYTQVGEVDGGTLQFEERKFASIQDADKYAYAVTALDDKGRESSFSTGATPTKTLTVNPAAKRISDK